MELKGACKVTESNPDAGISVWVLLLQQQHTWSGGGGGDRTATGYMHLGLWHHLEQGRELRMSFLTHEPSCWVNLVRNGPEKKPSMGLHWPFLYTHPLGKVPRGLNRQPEQNTSSSRNDPDFWKTFFSPIIASMIKQKPIPACPQVLAVGPCWLGIFAKSSSISSVAFF